MKKKEKKHYFNILNKINYKKHLSAAKDKFVDTLNLPRELTGTHSKITLVDNSELLIEGETNVMIYLCKLKVKI